jgi:hypothetical protein
MIAENWWATDAPPTWFAFVAAVAAALLAWRAYRRESETFRREAEAFHREREREKQEQASYVAVWPNKTDLRHPSFGLVNSSSSPVWSVEVYAYRWQRGVKQHVKIGKFDVGVTPPHKAARYFRTGRGRVDYHEYGYLYGMSFRDSSYAKWHRTSRGELGEGPYPDDHGFPDLERPATSGHGSPDEATTRMPGRRLTWPW